MSKSRNNSRCNDCTRTVLLDRRRNRPKYDNTRCYDPEPCQESCDNNYQESKPKYDPAHHEPKKWCALDATDDHPMDDATVVQDADAKLKNVQKSFESIVIKDSCDVEVSSTDTQAALNVQVALQVAIALVISISIADSSKADEITQDLNAKLKSSQINKQQVYIENSRKVNITTTDTDIAINVQILLQVLIALVIRLDVL